MEEVQGELLVGLVSTDDSICITVNEADFNQLSQGELSLCYVFLDSIKDMLFERIAELSEAG